MVESQELTFAFKNAGAFETYYCLSCALHAMSIGEQIINVVLEKETQPIVRCSNCGRIISEQI